MPYDIDPDRLPDLAQVSAEELGDLLVASREPDAPGTLAAYTARTAIQRAAAERQPRYTPEACRRMFELLVAEQEERGGADLTLALGALEHCTGPRPDVSDPARTLAGLAVKQDTPRQPYALLALAGLAGEDTLREALRSLTADAGPMVAEEMKVIAGLSPADRAQLSEIGRDDRLQSQPLTHAWRRAAGIPAYTAFARRALEAAADRTDAIRTGGIPYRADKAFTDREVTSLGRALRVALLRDEPWLPSLLDRLLPGVALAPTTAKTLPSQALLYEVARAAQDFPTPELATTLRTVRGAVRHAGVPKQLDKMLRKVDAALAERTEVALRLPRLDFDDEGVLRRRAGDYEAVLAVTDAATLTWEKDGRPLRNVPAAVRRDHAPLLKELRALAKRVNAQLATLLRALEDSFALTPTHPYGWWRTELAAHPIAGTVVRRLVWEIETTPGDWTAILPEATAALPEAPPDAAVRLWHPLHATPETAETWRTLLTQRGTVQPFKQAFREIYALTPTEAETRTHSTRFAAHLVHYRKMFALFRSRGWKSGLLGPWDGGDGGDGDEAEKTLAAGEWRARFHHTWSHWSGSDELARTDTVRFDHRVNGAWHEAPLADVPPLVFSEAMRDVDLFVAATSTAAAPGPE